MHGYGDMVPEIHPGHIFELMGHMTSSVT